MRCSLAKKAGKRKKKKSEQSIDGLRCQHCRQCSFSLSNAVVGQSKLRLDERALVEPASMTNDSNIQCTCFLAVLCCAIPVLCCAIPVLSLLSSTSVHPNPWTAEAAANVTKLAGLLLAVPGNGVSAAKAFAAVSRLS